MTNARWKDSEGGQAFLNMASTYKCGQCRKKFDKPWVVPTGKPFPNNMEQVVS